jgi:hypothetical protein
VPLTNNQKAALGATAGIGVLVLVFRPGTPKTITTNAKAMPRDQAIALIKAEAGSQGVDPKLALVFADLESNFKSNAIGDKTWHARRNSKGVTRWKQFVFDNPRYVRSPFRDEKHLWASYGLFQLLSPFELWREDANADPRILLDPKINARLAVAKLKRLQDRFGTDPLKIRLAYGGCTVTGRACPADTVIRIAIKLQKTAAEHGLDIGTKDQVIARAQALANNIPTAA